MRSSPLYFLEIPFEERLQHIIRDYGVFSQELLIATITRIQKRLGGLETKLAIQHMQDNQLADCFRILLKYYDKYYLGSLQNLRPASAASIITVPLEKVDAENSCRLLIGSVTP
jgi:tRNA 2-selenouridine synthase